MAAYHILALANAKLIPGRRRPASNARFQHLSGPQLRAHRLRDGVHHPAFAPQTTFGLSPHLLASAAPNRIENT
jgi:hypothetical protein